MPPFRLWVVIIALGAFLFMRSSGCCATAMNNAGETGGQGASSRSGGVYRLPLLNNPATLDPAYVHDIYGIAVVHQLFDGLVQFSRELFVIPALAENWRLEDGGRTYRFFLRKGALFHNGSPVTAQDVLFSLTRLLRVSPPPTILPHLLQISGAREYHEGGSETVAGLEALTSETFLIHLNQPYVPILTALGMYQASIVPMAEVRKGESFARSPIGTGAFRFVSWEENRLLRVKRFEGYYGGPSLLDGIDFLIYPGIAIEAVWTDFRGNQLEEMPVYPQVIQNLKAMPNLRWLHRPSLSLLFYGVNEMNTQLRDPALRQAMSAAIDREKLNLQVYNGQYTPAVSILPPGMPGYKPSTADSRGVSEAQIPKGDKAVEGHSGKPRSIEVVSNSQSPLAQAELAFVGEAWKSIRIELVPKYIPDWSGFEKYIKSDSLQLYRYAWFADIPDPDDFLRVLFGSESPVNYTHFRNEEADTLFRKAVGETDPYERARLYQLAEERILDARPVIPLLYLSVDHVYQPSVHGIELNALGAHATSYRHVWLDDTSSQ